MRSSSFLIHWNESTFERTRTFRDNLDLKFSLRVLTILKLEITVNRAGSRAGEPEMEFIEAVPRLSVAVPYNNGSMSLDCGLSQLRIKEHSPTSEELAKKGMELDENSNLCVVHSAPPTPTGSHNCPRFWQRRSEGIQALIPQRQVLQKITGVLRALNEEIQSSLPSRLADLDSTTSVLASLVGSTVPPRSSQLVTALWLGHCIIRGWDTINGQY